MSKNKRYHWYQVRYRYVNKGGEIFNYVSDVGMTKQSDILNKRKIKKATPPLHEQPKVKKYLINAQFDVEVMCYLGYFSNSNN